MAVFLVYTGTELEIRKQNDTMFIKPLSPTLSQNRMTSCLYSKHGKPIIIVSGGSRGDPGVWVNSPLDPMIIVYKLQQLLIAMPLLGIIIGG